MDIQPSQRPEAGAGSALARLMATAGGSGDSRTTVAEFLLSVLYKTTEPPAENSTGTEPTLTEMQSVLTAFDASLTLAVFNALVARVLLSSSDDTSINARKLHPKKPPAGADRFVRIGSSQKSRQAVWAHLPSSLNEDERARLLKLIQNVPGWQERSSIKLSTTDYAHLNRIGLEQIQKEAPAGSTPKTMSKRKASESVEQLHEKIDALTRENAKLRDEKRMSGPPFQVVHSSPKEMKIYVESGEGTRYRSFHNPERTVLTIQQVRPQHFPAQYMEGSGPFALSSLFSVDIATELAEEGERYEGRLVDGRKVTRTHDTMSSMHTLVYQLEPPLENPTEEDFGELV